MRQYPAQAMWFLTKFDKIWCETRYSVKVVCSITAEISDLSRGWIRISCLYFWRCASEQERRCKRNHIFCLCPALVTIKRKLEPTYAYRPYMTAVHKTSTCTVLTAEPSTSWVHFSQKIPKIRFCHYFGLPIWSS